MREKFPFKVAPCSRLFARGLKTVPTLAKPQRSPYMLISSFAENPAETRASVSGLDISISGSEVVEASSLFPEICLTWLRSIGDRADDNACTWAHAYIILLSIVQ